MFKLGEYYEDEAKPIMKYLNEAGIKAEVRTYTCASSNCSEYLEGTIGELDGEVLEIEEFKQFLDATRSAFAKGATPENFKEMFFTELDPSWREKKEKCDKIFEHLEECASEDEDGNAEDEHVCAEGCTSCGDHPNLDEDDSALTDMARLIYAYDFALDLLSRNNIESAEDAKSGLEDPVLRIMVDSDEYEGDLLVKQTVTVDLNTVSEIYVDEFTSPLFEELKEGFEEEYPEEALHLLSLGTLIKDLAEEPSPGKIDMAAFSERLSLQMETDGEILIVDGSEIADEVARILEKNDVIKHKGDTIKWKS
ncbi:MAG: hypothetical protein EHM14_05305 [Methanothrix sp.]|nr:MAG: hypothetical protein EHM14_05305 [Methanothrix sp.]